MKVTKSLIPTNLSQDKLDGVINRLMLDLQDYSKIACLDGRAFGVDIFNEQCEAFDINMCMRGRMWEGLIGAQELTEDKLGFCITPRYQDIQVYTDKWIGRHRFKPGIENVNVAEGIAEVEGFGPFAIEYYTQESLTVDSGFPEEDYVYVEFDRNLVWNIDDLIMRDVNGVRVNYDETRPDAISIVGDNWRLILDKPFLPGLGLGGDSIFAQDSRFMQVTITPPTLPNGGTLQPVYPNSNQIIPCAREPELLDSGDVRYWFHPWVLVDERRISDTNVSLVNGEFYKLIEEIYFKEFFEAQQDPIVTYLDCDGEYQSVSTSDVLVEIIDSPKGVVSINIANWIKESCPADFGQFSHVTIAYKTDPCLIGFDGEESTISVAIANLVSAELPLEMCQCEIDKGFIFEAQKSYASKYVLLDGTEKQNIRYGDKVGQKVYYDYLDRVPKKRKRVRV